MWCLEMGGGWSGWSLSLLPFGINMYVKTLMFIVEDGSISRLKNKIKRMLSLSTYHEKDLFLSVLSPAFITLSADFYSPQNKTNIELCCHLDLSKALLSSSDCQHSNHSL